MRSVRTTIEIDAPLDEVWEALIAFDDYPAWNPLILEIRAPLEVGAPVDFKIRLGGLRLPIAARMTGVDHERDLRWRGPRFAPMGMLFGGEHYFSLEEIGASRTRFVHGEDFSGAALPLLWWRLEPVVESGYDSMNRALKKRCEQRASRR